MKRQYKILIAIGAALAVLTIAAPDAVLGALIVYLVGSGIYTFLALRKYFSRDGKAKDGENESAR